MVWSEARDLVLLKKMARIGFLLFKWFKTISKKLKSKLGKEQKGSGGGDEVPREVKVLQKN